MYCGSGPRQRKRPYTTACQSRFLFVVRVRIPSCVLSLLHLVLTLASWDFSSQYSLTEALRVRSSLSIFRDTLSAPITVACRLIFAAPPRSIPACWSLSGDVSSLRGRLGARRMIRLPAPLPRESARIAWGESHGNDTGSRGAPRLASCRRALT